MGNLFHVKTQEKKRPILCKIQNIKIHLCPTALASEEYLKPFLKGKTGDYVGMFFKNAYVFDEVKNN